MLNKGNKGKYEALYPCNIQSRYRKHSVEFSHSPLPTEPKLQQNKKQLKHLDVPFVLNPQHRLHRDMAAI